MRQIFSNFAECIPLNITQKDALLTLFIIAVIIIGLPVSICAIRVIWLRSHHRQPSKLFIATMAFGILSLVSLAMSVLLASGEVAISSYGSCGSTILKNENADFLRSASLVFALLWLATLTVTATTSLIKTLRKKK